MIPVIRSAIYGAVYCEIVEVDLGFLVGGGEEVYRLVHGSDVGEVCVGMFCPFELRTESSSSLYVFGRRVFARVWIHFIQDLKIFF